MLPEIFWMAKDCALQAAHRGRHCIEHTHDCISTTGREAPVGANRRANRGKTVAKPMPDKNTCKINML